MSHRFLELRRWFIDRLLTAHGSRAATGDDDAGEGDGGGTATATRGGRGDRGGSKGKGKGKAKPAHGAGPVEDAEPSGTSFIEPPEGAESYFPSTPEEDRESGGRGKGAKKNAAKEEGADEDAGEDADEDEGEDEDEDEGEDADEDEGEDADEDEGEDEDEDESGQEEDDADADADDSDDADADAGEAGEGAESDAGGSSAEGDGGEGAGNNPTAVAIRQAWESKLAATPAASTAQRFQYADLEKVQAAFEKLREDEKPFDALLGVVDALVDQKFTYYHGVHVQPKLSKAEAASQEAYNLQRRSEFGKAYAGVLGGVWEQRMAKAYLEIAEKYGAEKADSIPLEHLFFMVGGKERPKSAKAKSGQKGKGSKAKEAQQQKQRALKPTRKPESLGSVGPKDGGKKLSRGQQILREAREHRLKTSRPFFRLRAP